MRLPSSLTCRRLAPYGLWLRLGLVAAVSLPGLAKSPLALASAPEVTEVPTLGEAKNSPSKAKAFAQHLAQHPQDAGIAWPDAKAYLLARRSASPVDYRNVLGQIGISPKQSVSERHDWLKELVELPNHRISALLQPVFADLIVTAGLLNWVADTLRLSPQLRREGLQTLFEMASHHRGTFVTGVDDAMAKGTMWTIPTLLLARAGVYAHPLESRTQTRLLDWIREIKADALLAHPPTRIRNPQIMCDFLLALAAIDDPHLAEQILPNLGAPNPEIRATARLIAHAIADRNPAKARQALDRKWTILGADPAKIPLPGQRQRQALAQALGNTSLDAHLAKLDRDRKQAWAKAVKSALDDENFDRLSALFAQDPGALVDQESTQAVVTAMDLRAGELAKRGEPQRAAQLWARAHVIAKQYKLRDHQLYARKGEDALLSVPELSAHARSTLHRSLRPKASSIESVGPTSTPGWKGTALALFGVLTLPGIFGWMRRRL